MELVDGKCYVCDICSHSCLDQFAFFVHLKQHYEDSSGEGVSGSTSESNVALEACQVGDADVSKQDDIEEDCLRDVKLYTIKQEDLGIGPSMCLQKKDKKPSTLPQVGAIKQRTLKHSSFSLCCTKCSRIFKLAKNLQNHTKKCHKDDNLTDKDNSPQDITSNSPFLPDQLEPDCDLSFEDNFDDDEETEHMYLQSHICPLCDEVCGTKENLEKHMPVKHGTVPQVNSSLAIATISDVESLEENAKKNLQCRLCSRVFGHRNSLVYHMRGHSGERPHKCDECGKRFFATSALKVHRRVHSGEKPYACDICNRNFRQWGDLKYHKTSIHSDVRAFQCEFCGKDFARNYSLQIHRRIHTNERNYKCDYCGKGFRAACYLQNHRKIHTGEKPHSCPICNKSFRVRSDMKRHVTSHSKDIKVATVIGAVAGLPEDFNEDAEIIPLLTEADLESQRNLPLIAAITTSANVNLITESSGVESNAKEFNKTAADLCVPVSIPILTPADVHQAAAVSDCDSIFTSTNMLTNPVNSLETTSTLHERMTLYQGTSSNLEVYEATRTTGSNTVVFVPLNHSFAIQN